MIGKTFSQYKILEKLGEGGMGVVYKAHDTKLDRLVALKFLPPQITVSAEDKARFIQEAKAASAVMHPNVCVIYDIAEHKGQQFIIMEYVDGRTLRQMVPVQKLQDAIEYAIQIGEALQEAHSKGVVHRDVKTDNIMVNSRNQVKVADFGLAKLKGSLKLTKTSSTVGTLAYMSPEQIRGAEVDARSDIFSFGVVFYEMLTGHLPFQGEYEAAVVYSIVNEEPLPVHKYRPEISSEVLHVLNRSLEKNPEERYQNVREMVIDLKRVKKEIAHAPRPVLPQPSIEQQPVPGEKDKSGLIPEKEITKIAPSKGRRIGKKHLVIMTSVGCIFVVISAIFFFKPLLKKPLPPMKIVPFANSPSVETDPAFSPDGNQVAYSSNGVDQKDYHIYVKLIGAGVPLRLTQNPGNRFSPVWSPDGRMVAFRQISGKESGIYKIPALGGVGQRLLAIDSANMGVGLDWSPDGGFLVYSYGDSAKTLNGIFMLSLSNLEKRQITFPQNGTWGDSHCKISPNGKWIAFLRQISWETSDILIVPFSGGSEKRITSDNQGIADLAWSQDGTEIIFSSNRGGSYSLWRVPFKGGELKSVATGVEGAGMISVSRKGQRLAYTKGGGRVKIWKGEMPKTEGDIAITSMLIAGNQNDAYGQFSHDGRKIAFSSDASGSGEIWMCDSDGSNSIQLTNFGAGTNSWSPDNRYLAFNSVLQGNRDIFIMNKEGGQLRRMTTESSDEHGPTWSRDGRWIYFTSNRSGGWGTWKLPVSGGEAIQVSKEGGFIHYESKDGRWLYYRDSITLKGIIWKLSLENGQKQLVLNDVGSGSNWVLAEDGIYYTKGSSDSFGSYILFFNFASNSTKKIAMLKQKNIGGLDISPDRGSFLISAWESGGSDIYLLENFR